MTTFLRLLRERDKAGALAAEVAALKAGEASGRRFEVEPAAFAKVPTAPFAYWVSERIRELFVTLPPFEGDGRTVKQGLATADDFRFVRAWWEVPAARILDGRNGPEWRDDLAASQAWFRRRTHEKRWAPFAKGGEYSPFYADPHLKVNWRREGQEIRAIYEARGKVLGGIIKNPGFYFRPGLTWPRRTNGLSFRVLPPGSIFAEKGPAIFAGRMTEPLARLVSLINSSAFGWLVAAQLARQELAQSFEVGIIQQSPVPKELPRRLGQCGVEAAKLKRATASWHELDHSFSLPALLSSPGATLAGRLASANAALNERHARLAAIQAEIDELCFDAYGFDQEDRRAALESAGAAPASDEPAEPDAEQDAEGAEEPTTDHGPPTTLLDPRMAAADLISWCVGVAAGRFDVRLATGARPIPELGDPFDPLPVCSPGMLQGEDGLPLRQAPAGYPLAIDEDGILLDLPGHPDDIVGTVREVLHVVFGERADAIEQEACAMLGARDLRAYFGRTGAGGFWVEHVKRFSKSRRVAPIYWLLASPQGGVKVWLYAHRLDRDTLPKLLGRRYLGGLAERLTEGIREVVAGRRLEELSASEAGRVNRILEQVVELEALVKDVKTVLERADDRGNAAGYDPDLDDGVVLAAAPLHALIPWPDTAKREGRRLSRLEGYWLDLEAGAYDWAKVAMYYWPERVEGTCRKDKSVAIAHGRLDLYEGEGA